MKTCTYPIGNCVRIYQDDGKWEQYSAWFQRTSADLQRLHIATYDLPTDDQGDCCVSRDWWDHLVAEHLTDILIY
jgi:hypothetical protein